MATNRMTQLPEAILPWYRAHRRDLPWRKDKNPYHIWLSEIMLQQTRVEAVKSYYARFLQALPTIADLADAPDELLHKLWEGLGYYSRVRNLKKAAIQIMEVHGGVFPATYTQVRSLPGIGPYTAGAICSIAYDLPTPAVDGNVLRVVSRLLADNSPIDLPATKSRAETFLKEIYPKQAGDFTQALMELGATVCGPNRKPDCERCPCKDFCQGFAKGVAQMLPCKSPKKERRQEDKTVFILECDGCFALEKRPVNGLLAGLWQFPNVPGKLNTEQAVSYLHSQGIRVSQLQRCVERKHIFTHIQWNMRAYYMCVKDMDGNYTWMAAEQIQQQAALPTAFRMFWEEKEAG